MIIARNILTFTLLLAKLFSLYGQTAEEYMNSGNEKFETQDYAGAVADYTKALEVDMNDGMAYTNRGSAKFHLEDYRSAMKDFDKAIKINPKNTVAYTGRGDLKRLFKKYRSAISDYSKAIKVDGKNGNAFMGRGLAEFYVNKLININKLKGACSDWSRAGELGRRDAYEWIQENCNESI